MESEMKRRNTNNWGERTKLENEKTKSENGGRDREREKNLEWREDWEMQGKKKKCWSKDDWVRKGEEERDDVREWEIVWERRKEKYVWKRITRGHEERRAERARRREDVRRERKKWLRERYFAEDRDGNERTTGGMGRTDERERRENYRRERDRENNNLRCRDWEEERECRKYGESTESV